MNEFLYRNSPNYVFLPPAFYDAMGQVLVSSPDITTEKAIKEAASLAGMGSVPGIKKIADRLIQEKEDDEKEGPVQKRGKRKASLGTSMQDWLNEMSSKRICYFLADFDPDKALHFYFKCDMLEVAEAYKTKAEFVMQQSKVRYEESLYGFGGSYEGDKGSSGSVTEIDATEGASPEVIRSLKALKF